ncbi:hypothetical protein [Streptomyces sp. NPDC059564]|uniref:hypothetical protein n=1 Tax=Streptomyces sp. NPDC059564 TaxID=3346865 RepID=UPI0036853FBF
MPVIPEKSAADGGGSGRPAAGGRGLGFAEDLRALYAAAGGGTEFGLKHLVGLGEPHGFTVADSTLSDWLRGRSVPVRPQHVRYVLSLLIPFLDGRAVRRSPEHPPTGTETWRARLEAAQAVRKSGQGGRGRRVHAASPGRLFGVPSQALQDVLPHEFAGRDEELAALTAFTTAPDGGPAYVWWQADAWAGKSALLAWFADRCLPAGVDVVHHFIAGRLGTNHRQDFVLAVGEQLASVVGREVRAVERGRPECLPRLFEDAARASAGRHRRLLLIVDGLDEDADAAPGGRSIAALLPKQPPHGMRVIVSGRPHPQVPHDVADGHPLRDPGTVRRLTASPAAHVIRDTALRELDALLDDPLVGSRLLGLLAAAGGALTGADLAALAGIRPHDIDTRLRSVVGRNMAPTDTDHLLLGGQADAEADVGQQTFVLAHEELRRAAANALGKDALAVHEGQLHTWADGYREQGWPEDTPNYLLTGYTRFTQRSRDTDRLRDLVLDPRRQLRLVLRSGLDVALADLDLVAPYGPDPVPPSLAAEAGVAVSREALLPYTRPLPRSVAPTVARRGDARRARAMAGASPQASLKAAGLAEVARALAESGHDDAEETAREAAKWARKALREASPVEYATNEAEAAAGQAALALLVTEQVEAGLDLLRSTRGSSTARYEAWAEAARLLAPHRPDAAAALLDTLEEEAEILADDDGTVAVQLWETVAALASDRTDRLHDRIFNHAEQVWAAEPTLEHVSVLVTAASALAQARPEAAAAFVESARSHIESMLLNATTPLSSADAFHLEYGFRYTVARLAQVLTDTGTPAEQVRRFVDEVEQTLPGGRVDPSEQPGDDDDSEADRLADEAFRLAGLGKDGEAKSRLDDALARLPLAGSDWGRAPSWFPALAGALVRIDATEDAERLIDLWEAPADRARSHAAVALAYADFGLGIEARRHACQAAQAAAGSVPQGGRASHPAGVWALAAQALACAGEREAAVDLIRQHTMPVDRSQKAAWRKADRLARIAVAAGLSDHDPDSASDLLLRLLDDLYAGRKAPRALAALLARCAELLPAVAHAGHPHEARLHELKDAAVAYADQNGPQTWQPESALVHALLRIGAGEDPGRQLDWLTRDLANRGPEHFPTAALAVVHAVLGDIEAARRVAGRPTDPRTCGAALAALAGHLARVPVHPLPGTDATQADPFTRTIRHLALAVSPYASPDPQAAASFLHQALATAGWHHALPALAQVEPEAVLRVRDIAAVHARAAGGS